MVQTPQKIDPTEQEIFLIIAREGRVEDLRIVGDGLLGQLIKANARSDHPAVSEESPALFSSPGYVGYKLNPKYTDTLKLFEVAMNLMTKEEFEDVFNVLALLGEPRDGDIVQFYGCF